MDKNKSFLKQSGKSSDRGDGDIEFKRSFPNPLPEVYDKEESKREDEKETPRIDKKPPNSSPLRSSPLRWPVRESLERV